MADLDDDPERRALARFKLINDSFYRTSPASYFEHRLNNLLVAAASDPELGPRLRAGLDIAGDQFQVGERELIESDLPAEELTRFITAESVVLLSHTAETTLRLFLAHEGHPVCPWMAMTDLGFREFWELLDSHFGDGVDDDKVASVVGDVMLGGPDGLEAFAGDQAMWDEGVVRLTEWLRHLTRTLVDNREHYNAAKHGFGAIPSEAMVKFEDAATGSTFGHTGPSLARLTRSKWINDERDWSISTRWYTPVELWVSISFASHMVEAIWSVGRARYRGSGDVTIFVPPVTPTDVYREIEPRWLDFTLLTERKT